MPTQADVPIHEPIFSHALAPQLWVLTWSPPFHSKVHHCSRHRTHIVLFAGAMTATRCVRRVLSPLYHLR